MAEQWCLEADILSKWGQYKLQLWNTGGTYINSMLDIIIWLLMERREMFLMGGR